MRPNEVDAILDMVQRYIPERAREAGVEEDFFNQYIEKKRKTLFDGHTVLVYERGEKILGEIEFAIRPPSQSGNSHGRIFSVCVDKEHKNRLIAYRLMKAAESYLLDHGCNTVVALPLKTQTEWNALVVKYGFTKNSEHHSDKTNYYYKTLKEHSKCT